MSRTLSTVMKSCISLFGSKFKSLKNHPQISFNKGCQTFSHRTSKKPGPGAYALLAMPLTAFGLGTWQVQRRRWKLNLIKSLEEKTQAPPIEFPEDLRDLKDLEYRKVRVLGTFDHSREIYITPRSPVTSAENTRISYTTPSPTGSFVVTPFTLSDKDLTILVNRGWVPRNMTLPARRPQGQIAGEVEIIGIIRHTEKRPPLGAKDIPSNKNWLYRNIEEMAFILDVAPVFIDATAETTVPGGPIGGQTRVTLRNEHFSYIVTWYTLAAATGYLWYKNIIMGRPIL